MKEFFSNLIAVILGIIITFSIQGIIDRSSDRKQVRSALELVRSELSSNIRDIGVMQDYLRQERKSAAYLLDNREVLDRCPEDSVNFHASIVFADASITLSQDALELLKMSSLLQKIGKSDLSMKIIRAYDTCDWAVTNLNGYIATRNGHFDSSINENTAASFASGGSIDIKKYLKTAYGLYALRWILAQPERESYTDVSDIEAAVQAIDAYIKR